MNSVFSNLKKDQVVYMVYKNTLVKGIVVAESNELDNSVSIKWLNRISNTNYYNFDSKKVEYVFDNVEDAAKYIILLSKNKIREYEEDIKYYRKLIAGGLGVDTK